MPAAQAVHEVAAPAGLEVPGAQKPHTWFVVLVPGVVLYEPAGQVVQGRHEAAPAPL